MLVSIVVGHGLSERVLTSLSCRIEATSQRWRRSGAADPAHDESEKLVFLQRLEGHQDFAHRRVESSLTLYFGECAWAPELCFGEW